MASHFQAEDTVDALFRYINEDCFLETDGLSLASGQGKRKLKDVFHRKKEVILNIVRIEDCKNEGKFCYKIIKNTVKSH